jgi:hypothetical protein
MTQSKFLGHEETFKFDGLAVVIPHWEQDFVSDKRGAFYTRGLVPR